MTFGITATGLATGLTIAGGVNALTGGGISKALGFGGSATGAEAQKMADPFMDYRANLAKMYSSALQPGQATDLKSMPGFTQFQTGVVDPAMEASKRSAAKSGMLYSGNEAMALEKTGQQSYSAFMTDYLNRLAQGSGATNNPATSAQIGLGQAAGNQQGFQQGLGSMAQLSGQFGSPTTSTPMSYVNQGYADPNAVYSQYQGAVQGGYYGGA